MNLKRTITTAALVGLLAGCAATTGSTVTVTEPSWETSAKKVHVIVKGKLSSAEAVRDAARRLANDACAHTEKATSDVVKILLDLYDKAPEHVYELKTGC